MIRDWEAGAVVVGVDGKSADDALDWAAAEAATRGCPLIVVHAFYPQFLVDPCTLLPVTDGAVTIPPEAEQVLGRAVNRARSVASELEVLAQLAPGSPAEVLLDQSRQASLLVLGDAVLAPCSAWGHLPSQGAWHLAPDAPSSSCVSGGRFGRGRPGPAPGWSRRRRIVCCGDRLRVSRGGPARDSRVGCACLAR
jgi:nucleotide-binding universal stress UspA family protein